MKNQSIEWSEWKERGFDHCNSKMALIIGGSEENSGGTVH